MRLNGSEYVEFKLMDDLSVWAVDTKIFKLSYAAKIDSGSFATLIGVDVMLSLRVARGTIANSKCVPYEESSQDADRYAFKVALPNGRLPIGEQFIGLRYALVPFKFSDDRKKYSFVTTQKFLIGMDVLRQFNIEVSSKQYKNKFVRIMKLTPHNLDLPEISYNEVDIGSVTEITDVFY
jgi:hypothetical protein